MRSGVCQDILPWSLLLILPGIAAAASQHYALDYGDGLGDAQVELNEDTHTALITPPQADSPTTLISFRKGLVVYVSDNECLVAKLQGGERKFKRYVSHAIKHIQALHTYYVTGSVPPQKVRHLIGNDLFKWCDQKPTLRLSRRRPNLPSGKIPLEVDSAAEEVESYLQVENEEATGSTGHQRYKRKAKKEKKKSKGRKGKSRRGRGKKNKNKKNKKPKTKSLENKPQEIIITPRIEFPQVPVTQSLTDDSADQQTPTNDHVILQEEPYLSPSFVRNGENGQRFRHYRGFYQDSNPHGNNTRVPDHMNRIISHDTRSGPEGQSRISIPETIVKDGQIFYRYDAEENSSGNKGQSKRRHVENHDSENDEVHPGGDYEDNFDSSLDELSSPVNSQGISLTQADSDFSHAGNSLESQHGLSHVQTQAQMGDGKRGASALAISGNGPATQVHGSSGSGGYFIAQAHSISRPGGRRSVAHVFGNKHGVQGTAMTQGHGHQSHVKVDMGAHPSSTGNIVTQGGSASLSSRVQATQLGGSAGAEAFGNGASASNAHMEFNPTHQFSGGNDGLKGQGLASATVTNEGSAMLTSLTGQVSSGSYLGTAHSSLGNDIGSSFGDENNTYSVNGDFNQPAEITEESGHYDANLDDLVQNGHFQEDLNHRRQTYGERSHGQEPFREISTGLRLDDGSYTGQAVDSNLPDSPLEGGTMGNIGNIMETVHQPNMQPEIIVYPASEFNFIDDGGLTVGAGIPPRESEIEQAPISPFEEIQEGDGRSPGSSKTGVVGLATYSHGRIGAPPGPGELLNTPYPQSFSHYDYSYYDNRYDSEYPDEEYIDPDSLDPNNLPYFVPEIVDFEPLESNYENLQPMTLPGQQVTELPGDQVSPLEFNRYDDLEQQITPNPPIIVHQVQAPNLLPDDPAPHSGSNYHSQPQVTPSNEAWPDFWSPTSSSQPVTLTPETPSMLTTEYTRTSQQQSSDNLLVSPSTEFIPDHPSFESPHTEGDTYSPSAWQESVATRSDSQSGRQTDAAQRQTSNGASQIYRETYTTGPHQVDEVRTHLQPRREQFSNTVVLPGRTSGFPQANEEMPPLIARDRFESRLDSQPRTHQFPQTETQQFPQTETQQFPQTETQQFPQTETQQFPHTETQQFPQTETQQFPRTETQQFPQTETQQFPQTETQQFPRTETQQFPQTETQQFPQSETQQFPRTETQQSPQTETGIVSGAQSEMMMETVPLYPGGPGSSRTLPGIQGGPDVKVMAMSASGVQADRSLIRQRPGRRLQPGEKIPGAPGYRVPPGFRGHVILGNNQPIRANSRNVVQGFNTRVQLSPQHPASNNPVFASVSGPGASRQLTSEEHPAGVHITLGGGGGGVGDTSQAMRSSLTMVESTGTHSSSAGTNGRGSMISSQQSITHSAMQSRPPPITSPAKSWDSRQHGSTTPQKSWNGKSWNAPGNIQREGDSCGYYSMNCKVVYGPYERNKICKPILITVDCCC